MSCAGAWCPSEPRTSKVGFANINAKAEGIETKPAFREAFRQRRCLVPVDNFYEWEKTGTGKQPYAIALADRKIMALAGLGETWRSPAGERIRSFAIVTTTPNELCAELHNRMPVILAPAAWPMWLGEGPAELPQLKGLLVPYPSDEIVAWPVGARVGNVKNNDPGLIPRVYQSGEIDRPGQISKCGDQMLRHLLYEAASALMTCTRKWSRLRTWGVSVAKRRGLKRATVAVARKLAVIVHCIWVTGDQFDFGGPAVAAKAA
jgi:putative SOS response-associated peptidase YedK